MKTKLSFLFFISVFMLLYSFRDKMKSINALTPAKYIIYLQENEAKFSRHQELNDVHYELRIVPNDLLFLNYMFGKEYSKKEYKTFQLENKGTTSFQLRISTPKNGMIEFLKWPTENGKSYEERVKYYSFELQKDINLKDEKGKDYQSVGYIFERNFGIQPFGIIHLVFPIDITKHNVTITLNDNGISKNQVSFELDKKELQFPKMKYTKQ